MKKIIVFLFVISLTYLFCISKKQEVIPDSSIRYRIIANSNSLADQNLKWQINNALIETVSSLAGDDILVTRDNIKANLSLIESTISNYTSDYTVSFGENFFPKKTYASKEYPEGYYESLVITLGSGNGDNFWCVLFPPLCLLEVQKSSLDEVTYDFYLKQIINKYF